MNNFQIMLCQCDREELLNELCERAIGCFQNSPVRLPYELNPTERAKASTIPESVLQFISYVVSHPHFIKERGLEIDKQGVFDAVAAIHDQRLSDSIDHRNEAMRRHAGDFGG